MRNLEFELHKVKREIEIHGEEYTFYRRENNEFNEPVGEEKEVCVIYGIYHEERGYVSLKTQEGANIRKKSEGQILCIIKDNAEDSGSNEGDTSVDISGSGSISGSIDVDFVVPEKSESVKGIKQGDYVSIGGLMYYVINVTDIQNYGIIANISLDLVV